MAKTGSGGIDRRTLLGALAAGAISAPAAAQQAGMSERTAFTFSFAGLEGGDIRMAAFAGRPVLVVNTASFCGFASQMGGLQALWTRLSPRGFALLGVPSNDFGGQEPGPPAETAQIARSHGVTFPLAAKARVVGPEAHPFYRWAAAERPRETPRWNFHKYLVGVDGGIVAVFPTSTDPHDARITVAVERELARRG
jgi:glutathione peroxidase